MPIKSQGQSASCLPLKMTCGCSIFAANIFTKMSTGEIILYQPDSTVQLEVRLEQETVWLSQVQMAQLFGCSTDNIGLHLKNIYDEGEIEMVATAEDFSVVRLEGNRMVHRKVRHYNLDAILSVGYRVSSRNATKFRQWATQTLKSYLLHGYAVTQRIERLEQKVEEHDQQIGFFVHTSLPPVEGVFYDGQIFDAYVFASNVIKSAKTSIVLIDNYADDSVLTQLTKRGQGVSAIIGVGRLTDAFRLDVERHNKQYPPVEVREISAVHDRFLLIDDTRLYTFGASFKDLVKKLFCFSLMENPTVVAAVRQLVE